MMTQKATVVFTPSGLRGEFALGTPVLQAAQLLGVDLESSCGGRGICTRCQVMPSIGEFPKHGIVSKVENMSVPSELEHTNRKLDLSTGKRLSCNVQILGDLVVDVPASSQLHKQHIVKEATALELVIDPNVKLFTLTVDEPDIDEPASDLQRVQDLLLKQHNVESRRCELSVMQQLQPALAKAGREITLALYYDNDASDNNPERNTKSSAQIIAVWPGIKLGLYGLAIDLGSTTIAAHLCELSSGKVLATCAAMNPQIRFGEDLMSRVSYVMMNDGGEVEMTNAVRLAFNQLAKEAAKKAKINIADIIDMTIVCNPIMHHLLLGIDPTPLGTAPFALATDMAITLKASELDVALHPSAKAFILPCIAGHIGADTAGMILAERPDQADEVTLLVDIGTNAEIVLGNKERLLAASSPTGPAFEGAQISCGQRAAVGAVERVRIDKDTLEPKFKVIGCDLWSTDEGFAEKTKKLQISGICGSGIIEIVAELFLAGVINSDGVIDGAMAEKSQRVVADGRTFTYVLHESEKTLSITQNDVRAIQLAKAALYAGIQLLMDHMQVTTVGRIGLAGAFGSHIDVKYAMVLGLIPDCDLPLVAPVGNAAGTGARIALLNREKRTLISNIIDKVEKIETATEAKFQDHFVAAMALPHLTDDFVHLAKEVQLPAKKEVSSAPRGGRTTSRRRSRSA
ncbi:MAG: ASKHA domain-containing protein [Oceanospirillaceae bacterium]